MLNIDACAELCKRSPKQRHFRHTSSFLGILIDSESSADILEEEVPHYLEPGWNETHVVGVSHNCDEVSEGFPKDVEKSRECRGDGRDCGRDDIDRLWRTWWSFGCGLAKSGRDGAKGLMP